MCNKRLIRVFFSLRGWRPYRKFQALSSFNLTNLLTNTLELRESAQPFSSRTYLIHPIQASVTDINQKLDNARSVAQTQARSGPGGISLGPGDVLKTLFASIPGGAGGEMTREMDTIERIRASAGIGGPGPGPVPGGYGGQPPSIPGGGKKPEDMSPQELHAVLWAVLTWRDGGG